MHREIDVECLPADIPEKIEIDVSELLVTPLAVRVRASRSIPSGSR